MIVMYTVLGDPTGLIVKYTVLGDPTGYDC